MRLITDRTQVLETRQAGSAAYEVCATSVAHYDEERSELEIVFDSFVRRVNPRGADDLLHPSWLPRRDVIRHAMSLEEAMEEAAQASASWAQKVRGTIPSEFAQAMA